jgi:O-antigen/teichoic acid export membrane protein
VVASIGALGAVVAGAAWAAGPTLLVWLVDPGYRVDGPVLAGLACAATMLAVLVLTGSVVLAVDRHRIYVVGWLVATLVTVLALLLPGTLEHRTVVSLTVGPLVGATIHWWFGLRTAGRARRRTAS